MSTSVGEKRPAIEEERLPDWSAPREPTAGRGGPFAGVVRRAAAAGLVVAVLWLLGHRGAAGVLLVVTVLVTAASARFSPFSTRIERAERAVQHTARRGLTLALLGAVQLLVFTPLWLLLRLVRHDPLALGSSPDAPTFWRPHAERDARPLYHRPFAYERVPRGAGANLSRGRPPLLRLRAVLGLIVIVALLDVGMGAAINGLRDDTPAQRASLSAPPVGAADRHEPWRTGLADELGRAALQRSYDPYLGWRIFDVDGKYVNVAHGVRRSYEPPGSNAGDAIRAFFFGGSALFGGFQRDQQTIPSQVARLAERDGIRLRVVNYGQLAYTNWQEVLLLESLVSGGSKPDLAVFYDGFNELLSQFNLGPHLQPSHLYARQIEDLIERGVRARDHPPSLTTSLYRSWADTSALHRLGRSLGIFAARREQGAPPASPWAGDQLREAGERGADAASVYFRGEDLAKHLADSYGFGVAFSWQPSIYTKHVVRGEEKLVHTLRAGPDAWRTASRVARSRVDPAVIDLGDALDGVRAPVMYDFVHTNELGAKVIARALYERLRPALRQLSTARRR